MMSCQKANDANEIMIRYLTHEVCHRTRRRLQQSISIQIFATFVDTEAVNGITLIPIA